MGQLLHHNFEPVWDENSKVLILGTFPSVKSRGHFYYHHPQNRFWPLMARLTGHSLPETIEDKKQMLLMSGIAIWDVISSCEIDGSSDASIRSVTPNGIASLLRKTKIEAVFCNGGKAKELFDRYISKDSPLTAIALPSTSPANAAYSMDRLYENWKIILDFIGDKK